MQPIAVESGSRLANRYRLEHQLTADDSCVIWRALDEKLKRRVDVRLIAADHPRATAMVEAAGASAMVGDTRFLQVFDATGEDEYYYVVTEWVPNAVSLTELLTSAPLDPSVAMSIAEDVAGAMSAAYRAGLHHLRLDPDRVWRTEGGLTKISGLMVDAALHATASVDPGREDARSITAILYAMLTGRWPGRDAFGLHAAPRIDGRLCSPRQVRAGMPIALDHLVMRGLLDVPPGGQPLASPGELAVELSTVPRPESEPGTGDYPGYPGYASYPDHTSAFSPAGSALRPAGPMPPVTGVRRGKPAVGPVRARRIGLLAVCGVLVVGLSLLGWQVVDTMLRPPGNEPGSIDNTRPVAQAKELAVKDARLFNPDGTGVSAKGRPGDMYDSSSETAYFTPWFEYHPGRPNATFGGNPRKKGVGMLFDLGAAQQVKAVKLDLRGNGPAKVEIRAVEGATDRPTRLEDFPAAAGRSEAADGEVEIPLTTPVNSRYVLVWFTELPGSVLERSDTRTVGIANIEIKS